MFDHGHPVERCLWLAQVLLVALAPWLLGSNRDWIWPWIAAAALLFGAATLALCRFDSRRHEQLVRKGRRLFWVAVAGLLLMLVVALLAGPLGVADARAVPRQWVWSLALLILTSSLVLLTHSRRRLRWVLMIWFGNAAALAMFGLVTTLSGVDFSLFGIQLDATSVARGPFINRNHFAGYLAVAGGLGFGLLCADLSPRLYDESWRQRMARWLALLLSRKLLVRTLLVVVVIGLIVSQSRMGNLAFAGGIAIAGLLALWFWRPWPPALLPLVLSIFVIDVIIAGSWFGLDRLQQRFQDTTVVASVELAAGEAAGQAPVTGSVEPSDGERVRVALGSLGMLRDHLWLGVGAGAWRSGFGEFKPATVHLHYQHAHNDWVQLLVERGVLGFLLYVALLGLAVKYCIKVLRDREDRLLRGAAVGILAGLSAMVIHGLADFNAQIPAYALFIHVLLGLSVNVAALPERSALVKP
ncbi:MAG: O-antigen ligase family protein [Ahniella sp.]|nr:O-antigen ligase family protein [Ahniella sp.]